MIDIIKNRHGSVIALRPELIGRYFVFGNNYNFFKPIPILHLAIIVIFGNLTNNAFGNKY